MTAILVAPLKRTSAPIQNTPLFLTDHVGRITFELTKLNLKNTLENYNFILLSATPSWRR